MIGMSGMQSEESALELTTSQNTVSVDNSEQSVNDESSNIVNNMSSPAPSQENVPVENQVTHNVAPDQSPVNTIINGAHAGFKWKSQNFPSLLDTCENMQFLKLTLNTRYSRDI
jgi:hypothetical protein